MSSSLIHAALSFPWDFVFEAPFYTLGLWQTHIEICSVLSLKDSIPAGPTCISAASPFVFINYILGRDVVSTFTSPNKLSKALIFSSECCQKLKYSWALYLFSLLLGPFDFSTYVFWHFSISHLLPPASRLHIQVFIVNGDKHESENL